nr:TRAM domain-containing protein [Candidatus Omnitrophota bacterium]
KKKRNTELLALQRSISLKKNKEFIGRTVEVLVEGKSRMSGEEMMGRTRSNVTCVFPGGEDLIGKIVNVQVTGASPNTFKGKVLG